MFVCFAYALMALNVNACRQNNDVKPEHLTAGGHLGSRRPDPLLRIRMQTSLELSLSIRAQREISAGGADTEGRRVGGVAAAKACNVGWRSRKMKEEEEGEEG